jgi:predicted GNAT family acetyltransferase
MSPVTDNVAANRFELIEDGHMAHADYRRERGRLFIDHVFTPPELRGRGAAGRLMEGLARLAADRGESITPICSYAAVWLQRHPRA